MKIALDVDVEAPVEGVLRQHQKKAVIHHAGVVDQHIHTAELAHDGTEHVFDGGKIRSIGPDGQRADAKALHFFHDSLRSLLVGNIVDGDIIALFCQRKGAGSSDAARRARHDCNTHAFALPSTTALTQPDQPPAMAAAYWHSPRSIACAAFIRV